MAKHKFQKAVQRLLREIFNLFKRVTRQLMQWLLRSYLVLNRLRPAQAGFVLPTLALMMVVVFLVVAAVMFRTFSRNTQVIRDYQTQQVVNAATPALDRAKAKIEYLFTTDPRLPAGIPDEAILEAMMRNDGSEGIPALPTDVYRYPDETRVTTLDGLTSGITPLVWRYTNNQNTQNPNDDVTTIYGVVLRAERQVGNGPRYSVDPRSTNPKIYVQNDKREASTPGKADLWLVRNGPLATTIQNSNAACTGSGAGSNNLLAGWFPGNGSATVYKNMQVFAVSVPATANNQVNATNKAISTLQYQQDRSFDRGNKWGAWFRYDLEVFPGQNFNWNGAMHSQSNIFVAGQTFRSYLISSPSSCFFLPESGSRITTAGELVAGRIREDSNAAGTVGTVLMDAQDSATVIRGQADTGANGPFPVDANTDSINPTSYNISRISVDPLRLQVQGISRPRVDSLPGTWQRDPNFSPDPKPATPVLGTSRVNVDINSCAPYVDDTYRADNRIGPKPAYSRERPFRNPTTNRDECALPYLTLAQGSDIGENQTLATTDATQTIASNDLIREDPLGPEVPETVGLDGFWERRARNEGLRIIVGERLELGNTFGWNNGDVNSNGNLNDDDPNAADPLYPLNRANTQTTSPAWARISTPFRSNEAWQLRTLYDNLAAVQGTAIYHAKVGDNSGTAVNEGGYFPTSCLASTVHPGTAHTLAQSATFEILPNGSANPTLLSNFFYGQGTNGWEFTMPMGTETAFAAAINNANSPLRQALENLSRFAGDPNGAFPASQDVPGGPNSVEHPYSNMAMWGNYSNLRRAIGKLSANYSNLSIADKSYLQTAACTLGLLAYNISYINQYNPENPSNNVDITALNAAIGAMTIPTVEAKDKPDYIISELERQLADTTLTTPSLTTKTKNVAIARILYLKEQIALDRSNGSFFSGGATSCSLNSLATATSIKELCPTNGTDRKPKFPALYYIFPTGTPHSDSTDTILRNRNTYITNANGATNYNTFTDAQIQLIVARPKQLGINLDQLGGTAQNWMLPRIERTDPSCNSYARLNFTPTAGNGDSYIRTVNLATNTNGCVQVAFKDSAIFNGREMMSVRLMNLDLNLMRTTLVPNASTQDTWLPTSGLVYAFREDAVREDAIVRPRFTDANSYANLTANPPTGIWYSSNPPGNPTAANQVMNVWSNQDPPLIPITTAPVANGLPAGISPKPIDYYPDPDRRPYGFRLRNGATLVREAPGFTVPVQNLERGLSFISDNPVYIQGHFNLHTTDTVLPTTPGSSTLPTFNTQEEFTDSTQPFYSRQTLNPNFGKGTDRWRQSEIIADAITILSTNWQCDGSIQSGIRGDNTGCSAASSYRNSNMQGEDSAFTNSLRGYVCANPNDPRSASMNGVFAASSDRKGCDGPIKVFRNGEIQYTTTAVPNTPTPYGRFRLFRDDRSANLNTATPTTINAVLVSAVTPSRPGSTNGGLHNFPRLIENWGAGSTALTISGSMLQLNFSNYATAPADQDAWEPGMAPILGGDGNSQELYKYYRVPLRRWGYDVALQITSAGPIARRMVIPSLERSEFFREPPADDPYICKLRKVVETGITCN